MLAVNPKFVLLLRSMGRWFSVQQPPVAVALGYLLYAVLGWLLLALPFCRKPLDASAIDYLFISVSALSTTGLATINTPDAFTFWGQLVIMLIIQVGGVGYMTFSSFVVLLRRRPLGELREHVGQHVFALPQGFSLPEFIRHVVIFTLAVELAGALLLYFAFSAAEVPGALWHAVFHSVSAFCTAGFSTFPNSLEDFSNAPFVNLVIGLLSIAGAIGFIVFADLYAWLRHRQTGPTLTTRIILTFTALAIGLAWFLLYFDPALAGLPLGERFLAAGFQAMTASTTVGFNTVPIGAFSSAGLLLIILLMVMGASPSGTGGGLKSTTVSAAIATVGATLRGSVNVSFAGRRIPRHRLQAAQSALAFYIITLLIGCYLLMLVESHSFSDLIFEAASALGTVGLSRGITGNLEPLGKLVLILLMFIGRMGPLLFGLALFRCRIRPDMTAAEIEDLAI